MEVLRLRMMILFVQLQLGINSKSDDFMWLWPILIAEYRVIVQCYCGLLVGIDALFFLEGSRNLYQLLNTKVHSYSRALLSEFLPFVYLF